MAQGNVCEMLLPLLSSYAGRAELTPAIQRNIESEVYELFFWEPFQCQGLFAKCQTTTSTTTTRQQWVSSAEKTNQWAFNNWSSPREGFQINAARARVSLTKKYRRRRRRAIKMPFQKRFSGLKSRVVFAIKTTMKHWHSEHQPDTRWESQSRLQQSLSLSLSGALSPSLSPSLAISLNCGFRSIELASGTDLCTKKELFQELCIAAYGGTAAGFLWCSVDTRVPLNAVFSIIPRLKMPCKDTVKGNCIHNSSGGGGSICGHGCRQPE